MINVAYGKDLDDDILKQLLYMEADAYATYDMINEDDDKVFIGVIPTETLKHFKKRMAKVLFLMKIKTIKSKRTLLGMACLSNYKKDVKYLHTVFVRRMWRKRGIGTELVRRALREAKKMKCSLSLGVNPLNHEAMKLYEDLGFTICKGQKLEMHALEKKNGKSC